MNKILTILFAFLLLFPSLDANAQTIQSVMITDSVSCFGGGGDINVLVNQTIPPTVLKVKIGYYVSPTIFIPIASTNNTTVPSITFPFLPSQNYTILLVDSISWYATNPNGTNPASIYDSTSISLTEPPPITVSESIINATNVLTFDGSIDISVAGGTPPYSYLWSGSNSYSSTNEDITNLQSGIYNYTVTDANGCSYSDTYTVGANQACSYGKLDSIVNPVCFGNNNGEIWINQVFGTGPFDYSLEFYDSTTTSWNLVGSPIFNIQDTFYIFAQPNFQLGAGQYRYTVIDSNGCGGTNSTIIQVIDPTEIERFNYIITQATDSTTCDGEIEFQIVGGAAPLTHSWTGPTPISNNALSPITNLCAGTYIQTVVDLFGCTKTFTYSVPIEDTCSPELEVYNIFCDQDSSGIAIVNRVNYAYKDSFQFKDTLTGNIWNTMASDNFAINLPAGGYEFHAYTLGGAGACPDTTIPFSIITPEINVLSLKGPEICAGESTEFYFDTINTDPSFIYKLIISNDILFSGDTSSSSYFPGIYPYTIEVDTGNGFISCFTNQNITITENDLSFDSPPFVTNEICSTSLGSIEVFASSSSGPVEYTLFLNPQFSNLFTGLSTAYYTVMVEDAINCVISQDSILVDLESNIVLDVDSSLETCRLNDGWIEVIAQGGYGFYTYTITDANGPFTSPPINNDTLLIDSLDKGYYNLAVEDSLMCSYNYGNIYIGKTPRTIIDSLVTKNESCCAWDGEIEVVTIPQNSVSIYSLDTFNFGQWAELTSQNSNIFNSLYRGDYLVGIEDTNGCVDSMEVTLEVDTVWSIPLTVEITDVVCNGDSNGTFKLIDTNQCYIYELYRYTPNTIQVPLDTGTYFNTLISGWYAVEAISNSGTCEDRSDSIFINEPLPVSLNHPPVVTDVRCLNNNSCNGEVYLITDSITGYPASGGLAPYSYYLKYQNNNIPFGLIPSTDTFQSLCVGLYKIQLLDDKGCEVVYDSIFVSDSSLYIDSFSVQNVGCYNGNDGQIEVFVSGGLGNYSYLWSNSDTTNIADSLFVSNANPSHLLEKYFISVSDSVGCFALDTVAIQHPAKLEFSIIGKKDETCKGVTNDGELYLNITGGTSPYQHMWSSTILSGNAGFGFGDTIFNLPYDSIIIDVTDVNYCNSTTWVTQPESFIGALNFLKPLSFDSIYFTQDTICFGSHSAFINIDLDGGEAPIQYSIDNMTNWSALNSFNYLNAGTYNIYVQDVYGCLDSATIDIIEYDEIIINYDSIKHVSCYNGNDGYISVSNSGGVSPYSYFWIPTNETTNQISDLYAVPYIIEVTDLVNCVVVDTIDLYELTEPLQTISSVINIVSCFEGDDGNLSNFTIGGMPPYDYVWINENSDTVSTDEDAIGIPAGTYTVFVSDSYNCGPAFDSIILNSNSEIEIEIINIIDNICFRGDLGELTIDVSGGVPHYFISLLDEDDNTTTSWSTTFPNLPSSTYMVWVTDTTNKCVSDTINLEIREPGRIQILNNIENLSCYMSEDGVINLSFLSGTPPYNYVVEYDNMIIAQSQVNDSFMPFDLEDLSVGEYYISVTDFNSCPSVDTVLSVSEPDEIVADFETLSDFGRKTFFFEAENTSVGGQMYYWDFGNDSTLITSSQEIIKMQFTNQGEYNVFMIAHDTALGHQCNDTTDMTVIQIEGYDVYNVFTPNNDGKNDVFYFNDWMLSIYVEIFNRWGERIYHWNNVNSGWDGKSYSGRHVEEGVYFYRLKATGEDGTLFEEKGSITLIR